MAAPTNLEQLLLEYVNAARLDPLGDASRFVGSYSPLTSPDPDVQSAVSFFGVSGSALFSGLSPLGPVQPLAWNNALADAARAHSQVMIDADTQSHQVVAAGESSLGTRVAAAGYNLSQVGENIFAFSESMLHAHAGFMIDWGGGPNGMQDPPVHRLNIMNAVFREAGFGVLEDFNPGTDVGPLVVTEDLGRAQNSPAVLLLGVAYTDGDGNRFYTPGEGRAGISIATAAGSTTTTSSGGYALGIAAGTHTITMSGGDLAASLVFSAALSSGTNAKFDVVGAATLLTSASVTLVSGVSTVQGLSALGLTLVGASGSETIAGTLGADTLVGGAGDDTFAGGAGNDAIDGGPGTDTVHFSGVAASYMMVEDPNGIVTVSGPEGSDLLGQVEFVRFGGGAPVPIAAGLDGDNVITGDAQANTLRGGGGSDTIFAGGGNDWIEGETGNDPFAGMAGNDTLHGEAGDDTVLAGGGDDVVYGGSGTDFLIGELGNDLMYGGSEWDAIDGRQGSDVLYGDGGADIIFGDGYFYLFGFSNDSLFGGDDNDIMMGEAGESSTDGAGDAIHGEAGNDLLDGGAGNDAVYGGDGNDVIDGDHGNDYIVGGSGAETMLGSNAVNFGGATNGSDLFAYLSMADAGDFIYGFDTRAGDTDGIDLRALFDQVGYAGGTPRADGYLYVFQNGPNTDVYVDATGSPNGVQLTRLLTLADVSASALNDGCFLFQ